ncbi:MAG: hypothetical protein WBA74_24190 [Cyclobacteriaceae bacterium]
MSDKIKPEDNESNQQNANEGTSGTNDQYQKALDNRSRQLNDQDPKGKN